MCYRLQRFFWAFTLLLLALSTTGCTIDEAEKNALSTQKFTEKYGQFAPPGYRWIPAGISALASLTIGILGFIKERRKGQTLKKAILTKADQIDKLIGSAAAATDNPGNVITKFMKGDTRTRSLTEKKDLHLFDAIRKGYR